MAGDHGAAAKRPEGRSLAEFPWRELSTAEKDLLACCATGKPAHFGDKRPDACKDGNRIRPKFLRFLALGGDDGAPVHEMGVQIEGAWIDGDIDFEGCNLPHRLTLRSCHIDGALHLREAQIVGLNLEGTFVRGILANRLRCTGALLLWRKFHSCGGVLLIGAKIDGTFDCEGGTFEDDAVALDCDSAQFGGRVFLNKGFEAIGEVRFRVASLARGLDCQNGRFNRPGGVALSCMRADIVGSAFLRGGFFATGEVQLIGAKIGGDFDCEGGRFENAGGRALDCEGATIGNRVFLRDEYGEDGLENDFSAAGEVRLASATIGGDLDCDGGEFANRDAIALACDSIKVGGRVFLRDGFHATGAVRFMRAKLGMLACERGTFQNPAPEPNPQHPGLATDRHGVSLNLSGAEIGGEAHLRHDFESLGKIDFTAAKIARDFSCEGARLSNPGQTALDCEGATVGGSVLLRARNDTALFSAVGEVRFPGAKIGGEFNCEGGRFANPGQALNCDGVTVGGRTLLKHLDENENIQFHATGVVRFIGAKLNGGLECAGGVFDWAPPPPPAIPPRRPVALYCDGAQVGGDVFLTDGFRARGEVSLIGIVINGDLGCDNGYFENLGENVLQCQRAEIKGNFFFREVQNLAGRVFLNGAHAAAFVDDAASWKDGAELHLDGFTYDRLGVRSPIRALDSFTQDHLGVRIRVPGRITWLEKQSAEDLDRDFKPQPWNQLGHVLYAMGHEDDAKDIRIEMRKRWHRSRPHHRRRFRDRFSWPFAVVFDWLLRHLVGYGYRPWRLLWGLAFVFILSLAIFFVAKSVGVMEPIDAKVFLAKGVPPQCAANWATFAGPSLPSQAEMDRASDAERARKMWLVDADAGARAAAAKKYGVIPGGSSATWENICPRAMPPEYLPFSTLFYSLEHLAPVLDLHQKARWVPHAKLDDCWGKYLYAGFVWIWRQFEIVAVLVFTLLLIASISGIIKKE
jgi:hypothetical protein